jgi:exoribonuclease-2
MPQRVSQVPGLEAQLRLQAETAAKLRGLRKRNGTLTFGSVEATPVVENDQVKDLAITRHNLAEDIIESFMVAANVAMARHLKEKKSLAIRRVVKTPRRWERIQAIAGQFGIQLPAEPDSRALSEFLERRKASDPDHFPDLSLSVVKLLGPGEYVAEAADAPSEGHFGLAVNDYTHSTAPNRRYADLVTQRLLKAANAGSSAFYAEPELSAIAAHCTEREDAARKVERLMRKVIAASVLSHRINKTFDAIVTGASPKGTYVRLLKFPAEGRVVENDTGIDVGDRIQVRLISVNVDKAFIDFKRV